MGSSTLVLRSTAMTMVRCSTPSRRAGDDGQDLPLVGHRLADGEGAVGPELDRLAGQRHLGVGLGPAVEDHFGIDVEIEVAMAIENALGSAAELRRRVRPAMGRRRRSSNNSCRSPL